MKGESHTGFVEPIDPASLGLRPVTRWVPDTRDPGFLNRYQAQCAVLAASACVKEEMKWWERLQTDEGWV